MTAGNAFLTLETRLYAILCDGRGADSSLGADALAKSIPVGRFRRAKDLAPLRDGTYPPEFFDRAVLIEWIGDADDNGGAINNPLDNAQICLARLAVTSAVLYGTAVDSFLSLTSGETSTTVALQPRTRALNDARRILRALACPDLLRGGTAIDPAPLACVREGGTSVEDLGDGRLVCVSTMSLRYAVDNASNYDP